MANFEFFVTFSSVCGPRASELRKVSQIRWDCLLCLF